MALNAANVQSLVDELQRERAAYLASAEKTHELLRALLESKSGPLLDDVENPFRSRQCSVAMPNGLSRAKQRAAHSNLATDIEVESLPSGRSLSSLTGDDSDSESEGNESNFVSTPLQAHEYTDSDFRAHLRDHVWQPEALAILGNLVGEDMKIKKDVLSREQLLPATKEEEEADRSCLTHYDIYDVGADGAPVEIQSADGGGSTIAQQVWRRISTLNADPNRSRPAVGRIVVVREPSPIMFANLHYVFNQHFDMDQIFAILKNEDPELAFPHQAFAKDVRHRTSFVVTFEYFTLIGEKCKPMSWQRSDKEKEVDENHISISRCSSVVALSLEADKPMVQVRNRDRRIQRKYGDVYDPFSPWRVLCIQAYPDWKATTGIHKPHHHYANGPEAFLVTLEAEFNDARSRMKAVYDAVADLVEPPADFLFDKELRDQMLFEDENFTYSRKYFWAYQTLSIINSDITEMIDAYRETFKDSVWDGTNKIIWPGESSQSSRYLHWRKKMAKIRKEIEYEIQKLEDIQTLIHKKLRDIKALRDNLFSGTTVRESRLTVKIGEITVQQNRSIKLLTLVTIFFLPLTFVTSVFGMTNMDPQDSFDHFAWSTIAICVPTYLFIGSLSTNVGLKVWRWLQKQLLAIFGLMAARALRSIGFRLQWAEDYSTGARDMAKRQGDESTKLRSSSVSDAMAIKRNLTMLPTSPPLSREVTRDAHVRLPRLSGTTSAPRSNEYDIVSSPSGTTSTTFRIPRAQTEPAMRSGEKEMFATSLSRLNSPEGREDKEEAASSGGSGGVDNRDGSILSQLWKRSGRGHRWGKSQV